MLRLALLAALFVPMAAAQTFTDASATLPPGGSGGSYGGAIIDVDGDGRTDVVGPRRVLLATDGGFRALAPFDTDVPIANTFADVDGDGRLDAFVIDAFEPGIFDYRPALEQFVRSPTSFEVGDEGGSFFLAQGSVFLDADRDGALDVFVGNDGGSDLLYRGTGDGSFTDAHERMPAVVATTYGAHATDFDRDGDTDIAIGICPAGFPNLLYRNDGDAGYTEIASAAGMADERASWGVVWTDIDNDGWPDLYVANMPDGQDEGPNALYRNNQDGTFTDVAVAAGVAGLGTDNGWNVLAADFDNDGWTDLVAINNPEPSRVYLNNQDGTFTDATASALPASVSGVASAVGDVNDDGWPDLFVSQQPGSQVRDVLMLNDGGTNGWLRVRLRGVASTPDGVGARVEVAAGDLSMSREITGGDGMMGQSHGLQAHFGLGTAAAATVTVRWPSGAVDTYSDVAPNQLLTLVEGIGPNAPPQAFALSAPADGGTVDAGAPLELSWEPATDDDLAGYTVVLSGPDGDATFAASEPSLTVPAGTLAAGSYAWTVEARDAHSMRAALQPRSFVTGTLDGEAPPQAFASMTVGPNPSRGAATVRFELARAETVTVEVIDVLGRRVWHADLGARAVGPQAVTVPADAVGPGAYLVRLAGGGEVGTVRLTRVP